VQQGYKQSVWKELILVTVVGILFSRFSLGSVIMTIPLLMIAPRVKDLWQALLAFAVVLVGTVLWSVLDYKNVIEAGYGSVLAVSLFLPICTVIGTATWTAVSRKSRAGMRKFFLTCIPIVVLGLALALWFSSDNATSTKELLKQSMLAIFSEESLGYSFETVVDLALSFLSISFLPMGMLIVGIPVLISELIMYRYDEAWQYDFAFMKLPDPFIWGFFGFWVLALTSSLVSAIPLALYCVAWNVALALTVLFAIQGLSIIVARFRRTSAYFSVGKVVGLLLILCLLPGVNLICIVGLPVLGVLETWFRFR
jgi:hypothetical protein